jgi:hypothetical protein
MNTVHFIIQTDENLKITDTTEKIYKIAGLVQTKRNKA